MNRTGSSGSRVPPADTRTDSPTRSPPPERDRPRWRRRARASTAATMSAGSASRPCRCHPRRGGPHSGSTTCTPRDRRVDDVVDAPRGAPTSRCAWPGQTTTGARVAMQRVGQQVVGVPVGVGRQQPCRRRRDDDQVGALAQRVCGNRVGGVPAATSCTGSDARAENVSHRRSACAPAVITGTTWAPASTRRRHTSIAL